MNVASSACFESREFIASIGKMMLPPSLAVSISAISSLRESGESALLTYRFCSRCGIRLYATGELPQLGGRFYALHVPTLDDVDREELVNAPLRFVDNAHDRPDRVPTDTRLM